MKRSHRVSNGPADESPPRHTRAPRRRVLSGIAGCSVVALVGLAGCLGDEQADEDPAEPIGLTGGLTCDVCGMVIEDHPGPAAQAFYADGRPDDRDGPVRFDSVVELVTDNADREEMGWELRAVFVTDYSAVSYDLHDVDETTFISVHPEAEHFVDGVDAHYVVGSDVFGAMGEEYLPFSDRSDAEDFTADHGGRVESWASLDPAGVEGAMTGDGR